MRDKIFFSFFLLLFLFNNIIIYSSIHNTKIIIFCYHRFQDNDGKYSINTNNVEKHIEYIKKRKFEFINEKQLYDFYYNNKELKPRNVLISIDDGFKDSYDFSLKIYHKYKIQPIIFINSSMIGIGPYLKSDEIKDLYSKGFSIGNHSHSHFKFNKYLDLDNILEKEIIDSNEQIKKIILNEPISYAHPYGIYNKDIVNYASQKFKLIYTTNRGPNVYDTNPLKLNRYVITTRDNEQTIGEYLDYDLLPIIKTIPEDGDIVKNNKVIFIFESIKERKRFKNFIIELVGNKYEPQIKKNLVIFNLKKIKYHYFNLSLIANDGYNNKYIYSIMVYR